MTLKRALLSRGSVVGLVAPLAAMMVAATLVPQAFLTSAPDLAAWREAHPALAPLAEALGLHRVYTHPVFLALLAMALLGLLLSAVDQLRAALRRTRGVGCTAGAEAVVVAGELEAVARALRARGYLTVRRGPEERALVRQPWGYWGNSLLHAGLALAAAASLVVGATQQRGALHLVEGEMRLPARPWDEEENGVAASRLVLPWSVRLDHVEYRHRPEGGLESAGATLSLLRPGAPPERLRVGINAMGSVDGVTVYQSADLGHAFAVALEAGSAGETVTLLLPHPATPADAGRNDFPRLLPGGDLLRAKYLVDAAGRSFDDFNPVLFLRVERAGAPLGEAELRPATSAAIGPYRFRLDGLVPWARLFFVRIRGVGGVFAGFLVIALGGVLHYFTAPREVVLSRDAGGGTRLAWRAARFTAFYEEERDELLASLRSGGPRG